MKLLRIFLLSLAAMLWTVIQASNISLPNEDLNYRVMFKWGLINKKAGSARLKMRYDPKANTYTATVYARSEPWADRVYELRDTLSSVMESKTLAPLSYERIAYENGRFEHDRIAFSRIENTFIGECIRHKRGKKDTETTVKRTHLEAEGMTVDFISAFYYLRLLDFQTMMPGHSVTINIFSGKRKELLKFTFKGIESIKVSDKKRNAFKVQFRFTSDGKKETSDPITAWISTDSNRIPLLIEGKLPIGKIRCELE